MRLQREVSLMEEAAKKASGTVKGFAVNARLGAAYTRMRRLHAKVRNQRNDFYEKLTTWMAQTFGHIITEELNVSSMLTDESKGSGLKRGISDAAWATGLLDKISRKAEEAGGKFEMVPTRQVKPTRRCNGCGLVKTKEEMPMSQRLYVCAGCGFTLPRDTRAATWRASRSRGPGGPKTKGLERPQKLHLNLFRWSSSSVASSPQPSALSPRSKVCEFFFV